MELTNNQTLSWEEFALADKSTWKAQILQDIKAATAEEKLALYESNMQWKTHEGITVEPFYTAEDLATLSLPQIPAAKEWQNRQYIGVRDVKVANTMAIEAINSGATAIIFDFLQAVPGHTQLSQLLHHIKLSQTPVSFLLPQLSDEFITSLTQLAPYQWKGSLYVDPFSKVTPGKASAPDQDLAALAQAIVHTKEHPHFRVLTVSSHHWHEAGASAVQELAFLLSTFVEYAHRLSDMGMAVQNIFAATELSLSVSTNYFAEIAKLRALHVLWLQLGAAYAISPPPLFVHAQTARWNKPEVDSYNNIIRGTIEAMAAVLGGSRAVTVMPYNHQVADAFAARMARNIPLILKEESYFDKVLNVASGAYYIEYLTYSFATEAWKLFKEVESQGGYLQALENGFIRTQISKVREAKEAGFASGKQILVGVNKYAPKEQSVSASALYKEF